MNTNKTSAQLKSLAKGQLLGKYSTVIGAFLLMEVVMLALSVITSFFVDQTTTIGLILNYIITFLIGLFAGIFSAGQAYVCLNICCNRSCKATDVFYGFTQHPDKALLLQLVISSISFGCMIPTYIVSYIGISTKKIIYVLPACILLIIGTLIAVYFSLCFSQVFYLLLDFPDYSVKQILSLSKKIMEGQKGRFFYLLVSFLPLYLLGLLSCCVAYLWIVPYVNQTTTNFYLDLMKNRKN